ncbi:TIGR01841 family phasin [Paraburkholderia aromaticivorans]|uniref:TIGR01841 family phasin n=1 Tax=Paraburkholderia aromaticivorans TaxID=2026199 RepID=UPI0014560C75|nr:TIGR01841 family phasin [Paraburkholderia aromaticivorans]
MTQFSQEQFAAAQKKHVDTFFSLTGKFVEGVEKLSLLNLQAAKSIFAETQETAQKALAEKELPELFQLHNALLQPAAEKGNAYSRQVYEILTDTHQEFVKLAEAQFVEYSQNAQAFVDSVTKNAPAGSESAVALLKSTITAAHTAYDTVNKATRQAAEIAENNFNAVTIASSKAVKESAAHTARAAKAA